MQVLSIMKMQGDPDEILTNMQEVEDVAARKAPEYGAISNTVVKTDDGIMIINLWGDEEGRHKLAADPEIQAALQKIDMRPDFKAYDELRYRTGDQ
jgi:hypothetical protein